MKKILLLVCTFVFATNIYAQMTDAVIEATHSIQNRPATGTADSDYPSISYVMENQKILTIGEIKKIITEYVVGEGYAPPKILRVEKYSCVRYGAMRTWTFYNRAISKYSGEDTVHCWYMTQKYSREKGWETSLKSLSWWFFPSSTPNSLAFEEKWERYYP